MSNEIIPLVSVEKLQFFGNPHHGVYQNGILTKSDGSTMQYPAISSASSMTNGNTQLIKFDNTPQVNRSAEQIISDINNKYEFLDYAILSGTSLAGKDVGKLWLYKDNNGNVVSVNASLQSHTAPTLKIRLTYSSFGKLSILSQNQSPVIGHVDIDVTTDIITSINKFTTIAVSPNGKKACIFAAYESSYTDSFLNSTQRVIEMNAIEITLSGSVNIENMAGLIATATVVSDASSSVSMVNSSIVETSPQHPIYLLAHFTRSGTIPNWNSTDAASPVDITLTATYSAATTNDTSAYSPSIYVSPEPVPLPSVFDKPQEYTEDITIKLLNWAFYDTSNHLKLVHSNVIYQESLVATSSGATVSGQIVLRETSKVFQDGVDTPGGQAPRESVSASGGGSMNVNINWTRSRALRYEIIVDNITQDVIELNDTKNTLTFYDVSFQIAPNALNGGGWYQGNSFAADGTHNNASINTITLQHTYWDGVLSTPSSEYETQSLLYYRDAARIASLRLTSDIGGDDRGLMNSNMAGLDAISALVLTNNLVCMHIKSDDKSQQFYRAKSHPEGVDSTIHQHPYSHADIGQRDVLFATYHPITHQIITEFGAESDSSLPVYFI